MNRAEFLKAMVAAGLVPAALRNRPTGGAVVQPEPEAYDFDERIDAAPHVVRLDVGGHSILPQSVEFCHNPVNVTDDLADSARYASGGVYLNIEAPSSKADDVLRRMHMDGDLVDVSVRMGPDHWAFDAFVSHFEQRPGWEAPPTTCLRLNPAGPVRIA